LRVFAEVSASAATATIRFVMTEPDGSNGERRFYSEDATVTGHASAQMGMAGNAGNYRASVVFTQSGRDTVDLLGHKKDGTKVYIGTTVISSGTVRVRVDCSRDA
jgi:hypothetical protein